jgi:hypothetical protein
MADSGHFRGLRISHYVKKYAKLYSNRKKFTVVKLQYFDENSEKKIFHCKLTLLIKIFKKNISDL